MRREGMGKRIAIVQSSYIPWKGYFDLINSVDEFVLYDDVQFTRRDWRSRNRIKTSSGAAWLSIPVKVSGQYLQKIRETQIASEGWGRRHWASICHSYARAPHFARYRELFEDLYLATTSTMLSEINYRFLTQICGLLGIGTRLSWSMDYTLLGDRTERLASICQQAGATEYLSGPSAKAYVDSAAFESRGIGLRFVDYDGYPEYPQLHGAFDHKVSIIDLILNVGPAAPGYLKSFARARPCS